MADSSIELRSSEINERISASVAVIRVEGRPLKCTKVKARERRREGRGVGRARALTAAAHVCMHNVCECVCVLVIWHFNGRHKTQSVNAKRFKMPPTTTARTQQQQEQQ